jgi:8-oxo-dGTP pyrophosphatase MutT (NUDIX family)
MNIINEMTEYEKKLLLENDFEILWNDLWKENCNKYKNEKEISKKKFYYLKLGITNFNDSYCLNECIKESTTSWKEAEWGFPKGRRDNTEKDIETAYREFTEETGIPNNKIAIIENIMPFEEMFTGSNFKSYKHKYYIATLNNSKINQSLDNYQESEVGKIEWKTLEECLLSIRPYNLEKKEIITNVEKTLKKYVIVE